jgi:hypothetical protein
MNTNKIILSFPLHDPHSIELPQLIKILPTLEEISSQIHIALTPATLKQNINAAILLKQFKSVHLVECVEGTTVGDHFMTAITSAVSVADDDSIIHICNTDRIINEINNHKDIFIKDLNDSVSAPATLFIRSQKSWQTHPTNYYLAEKLLSDFSNLLFKKNLDFVWCQMSVKAFELRKIVQLLKSHGFSDLRLHAYLLYLLKDIVTLKEVDWLDWEDPYVLNIDPSKLRHEKENSIEETKKRLSYVSQIMGMLIDLEKGVG